MKVLRVLRDCCFNIFLIVFVAVFSGFASSAVSYCVNFETSSKGVYFVNLDSDRVIYSKDEDLKICPGALVKMMTVILVLEEAGGNLETFLDEQITAKTKIFDRLFKKNASNADIRPGEEVKVRDLLYAAILRSASEATMMLVDYLVGDDVEKFVEKMNAKAEEIGLKNTKFSDPDGLDEDGQYTTARDVFILTQYCMKNETFKKIAISKNYEMEATNIHKNPRTISHTNLMVNKFLGGKNYDKRVLGIKTGSFCDSKNLVSMASGDGYNYMCVVLGAPAKEDKNEVYRDAEKLYNWAFKELKFLTIAVPFEKSIPNKIKVRLSDFGDSLVLTPKEQIVELLPRSIDESTIYWDTSGLPKEVDAPIKKGQVIGKVSLKLSDQVLRTVDVVAAKGVKPDIIMLVSSLIKRVIFSWWFILTFCVLVLIAIIILFRRYFRKRRKVKKYRPFSKN